MKLKSAMSSVGNGLLNGTIAVTTALNNGPIHTRIAEIDGEITRLQDEKTRLQKNLIK